MCDRFASGWDDANPSCDGKIMLESGFSIFTNESIKIQIKRQNAAQSDQLTTSFVPDGIGKVLKTTS